MEECDLTILCFIVFCGNIHFTSLECDGRLLVLSISNTLEWAILACQVENLEVELHCKNSILRRIGIFISICSKSFRNCGQIRECQLVVLQSEL